MTVEKLMFGTVVVLILTFAGFGIYQDFTSNYGITVDPDFQEVHDEINEVYIDLSGQTLDNVNQQYNSSIEGTTENSAIVQGIKASKVIIQDSVPLFTKVINAFATRIPGFPPIIIPLIFLLVTLMVIFSIIRYFSSSGGGI